MASDWLDLQRCACSTCPNSSLASLFSFQGEMGPKGEPGIAGHRGPTGRPGKRGKQVRVLGLTTPRQSDLITLAGQCGVHQIYRRPSLQLPLASWAEVAPLSGAPGFSRLAIVCVDGIGRYVPTVSKARSKSRPLVHKNRATFTKATGTGNQIWSFTQKTVFYLSASDTNGVLRTAQIFPSC